MAHGTPSNSHDVVRQYDGECAISAGLTAFVAVAMIGAGISDAREQSAQRARAAAAVMCHDTDQSIDDTPLAKDEQCRVG